MIEESNSSSRGIPEDEWPHFRGDNSATGNTTASGLDYYNLGWERNLGIYWGSPVVHYDKIYVAGQSRLYCLDMDGNQVWSFNAGNLYATPTVYNGRVYYASGAGTLYCLDANATGSGTTTQYWAYTSSGASHSSPTIDGKLVFFTKTDVSGVHAVYINNGTKAWNASLDGATNAESSPSYWNGYIYVGSGEGYGSGTNYLYCFYANNGTLRWKYNAGAVIASTPAVEYGYVYFGTYNGRVFCLDADGTHGSTTKLWEYNTGSGGGLGQGILGSASIAYDEIYIAAGNSRLYCLDAYGSSGGNTAKWNPQLTPVGQYGIFSSPAVTANYVYVGTGGNALYCLNRDSGSTKWKHEFPFAPPPALTYGITTTPAIYKDHIIVSSDNGNLYVMQPDTTPPKISSTDPADTETDVDIKGNITVTFDEIMNIHSITTSTITVENSSSGQVTGTVTRDMSTGVFEAYFSPTSPLEKDETYTVTVKTGIIDLAGNTLDGNGNGVAEGAGVDEYTFSFTTIQHGKPLFNDIEKLSMTEDIPNTIDIGMYVSDSDTAKKDLLVKHNTTYGNLDDFNLTLLYPEGVLYDLINISISDGIFTVFQEVEVGISAVNDLPVISAIPPLALTEDISYELDMKLYVTDVDTSYENLKMFDNSKYATINGMIINFTYTEGVTEEIVTISIRDGGYTVDADIDVTIEPVNDPPTFDKIPDVYVEEDIVSEVTCTKYISDIDTHKDDLVIIVDSPYVTVLGHKLILLYPEKISEDELVVKVFDGDNYAQITLKVFVQPVNDQPRIVSVESPKEGYTYEYNASIDLLAVVTDPDLDFGDSLTFSWVVDNAREIATTQNATGVVIDSGIHTVSLIVTDLEGSSDRYDVSIIVKQKPVIDEPDPSDDPQDQGDTNRTGDDKKSGYSSLLWIGLVLAVVIVVVIIVLALFLRKKKSVEREPPASLPPQEVPAQYTMMPPASGMGYPQQFQPYPDQAQLTPGQYPQQYPEQYPGQLPEQYPGQYQDMAVQPQLPDQDYYGDGQYPMGYEQFVDPSGLGQELDAGVEDQVSESFMLEPGTPRPTEAPAEPGFPPRGPALQLTDGPMEDVMETSVDDITGEPADRNHSVSKPSEKNEPLD